MNIRNGVLLAVLSLGIGLSACSKKEDSPAEKAVDKVEDGLNMRDHEKLKDAGENVQDAVKDAKEGVKDETQGDHK